MKYSSRTARLGAAGITALSLTLAACGGGSSGNDSSVAGAPPPAAANTAPKIADLAASESIAQDSSSAPLVFSVNDAEASASSVNVTVESSDAALIAPEAVVLSGNDSSRALMVTPTEDMAGTSTLTVTATDAQGLSTQRSIAVTVTSQQRSFPEMVGTAYARDDEAEGEPVVGYSWVDESQDDETAYDHLFTE